MHYHDTNVSYKRDYLEFDFKIDDKFYIEFDGKYHFEPIFGEESFKEVQIKDAIKNSYCEKSGIKLLRIPYYEEKNIDNILREEFKL